MGVAKGTTNADLELAGTVGAPIDGQYGKLTLNGDGSYSYSRNAGTPGGVQDIFTYTIKDADGDLAHTTLSIDIGNGTISVIDLKPQAQGGDAAVYESALLASRDAGESAGSGGGSATARVTSRSLQQTVSRHSRLRAPASSVVGYSRQRRSPQRKATS